MFLLGVLLARVVGMQREQIAAMKALGYRSREVGVHYLQFALVLVLPGTALGLWLGVQGGRAFTDLYMDFFRFPSLELRLDGDVVASAVALSVVAALVGAWARCEARCGCHRRRPCDRRRRRSSSPPCGAHGAAPTPDRAGPHGGARH